MGRTHSAGFTLVELMITIAILAILLALGLPSFQGSMRSTQVATGTNELISSFTVAGGVARKGRGAGICATANGTACGADWNLGWMIWDDANGDGVPGVGENIVRHFGAHPSINVTSSTGTIAFNSRGEVPAGTSLTLKPTTCPSPQLLVNTITLNTSGQVKTAKSACP